MATGKVTVQPKALLKLPKELPSNIVSDSLSILYFLILIANLNITSLCANTYFFDCNSKSLSQVQTLSQASLFSALEV